MCDDTTRLQVYHATGTPCECGTPLRGVECAQSLCACDLSLLGYFARATTKEAEQNSIQCTGARASIKCRLERALHGRQWCGRQKPVLEAQANQAKRRELALRSVLSKNSSHDEN